MTNHSAQKNVRVSVVMCTYNGARFLEAQMDSILAQDYPLHEIIVQDDGSTDGTTAILDRYAARHDFIKVFRNAGNLGYNRNFHSAMLRATGDFIAISDQDDIWFPHKISRQVAAIGEASVCYSGHFVDAACPASTPEEARDPAIYKRPVSLRFPLERLMFSNCVPGHAMLVRREFLLRTTEWDYHLFYDWWLAVCAVLDGGLVHLDEPLNWHRPHAASAITELFRQQADTGKGKGNWKTYVTGWRDLHRMRRNASWRKFYTYIHTHTSDRFEPRAHALSGALLGGVRSLPRLCRLCLKWRAEIYPAKGESEWKNRLRAFCWPAIYAHGDISFKK